MNTRPELSHVRNGMQLATETDLMKRALANAASKSKFAAPLWAVIIEIFAVGSEHAKTICIHYGFDPEEIRHNYAFHDESDER